MFLLTVTLAGTAVMPANAAETANIEEMSAEPFSNEENVEDCATEDAADGMEILHTLKKGMEENGDIAEEFDTQEEVMTEEDAGKAEESVPWEEGIGETCVLLQLNMQNKTLAGVAIKENTENPMPEREIVESNAPDNLIPSDNDKEKKQYRVLKNNLFLDYDNCGVKKIVTELKKDGFFIAEDLGSWLKAQDVYDITVVEDNGDYKKLYYESNQEKQDKDRFYFAEDAAAIHFDWLVYEGDVITCTDTCLEEVTSVESDGSFYTEYTLNWLPADE